MKFCKQALFLTCLVMASCHMLASASTVRSSRGGDSFPTYRVVVLTDSQSMEVVDVSSNGRFIIGRDPSAMYTGSVLWDTKTGIRYPFGYDAHPVAIGNDGTFIYSRYHMVESGGYGIVKNPFHRQLVRLEWKRNYVPGIYLDLPDNRLAVNAAGQMIGLYKVNVQLNTVFPVLLDKRGIVHAITGKLVGWAIPLDINDRGFVLCQNISEPTQTSQSVLWKNGEFLTLPIRDRNTPLALNNRNEVVGLVGQYPSTDPWVHFLYSPMTGMQYIRGFSSVKDLNDNGWVVGSSMTQGPIRSYFQYAGAIWKSGMDGKRSVDLNTHLHPSSSKRWWVFGAEGINNEGTIVAQVYDRVDPQEPRPYIALLVPVFH